MTQRSRFFAAALVLTAATAYATAGITTAAAAAPRAQIDNPPGVEAASLAQFVTHHEITVNGDKVVFTATAGETLLYDDAGNPTGSLFSYAYTKDAAVAARRPVMFITGGGPGAASYSLNVGLLGPWTVPPQRLSIKNGRAPSSLAPFSLAENHNSLLDTVDLVFIDPIGTGYSRAVGRGKNEDFWSLDDDLESIAQFIQLWLSKNGRWDSPKFFLGESYGGTRAALLSSFLMGGPSLPAYLRAITLNGVVVMSNGLGLALGADGLSPEWQAATALPNEAAAAWYHSKIDRHGRTLDQYYEEVTQFAFSDFIVALLKDNAKLLSSEEREKMVMKLGGYTGLPPRAYEHSLALSDSEFSKALLADKGLMTSNYDSRYTYQTANEGGDFVADDASLGRTFPIFVGAQMDEEHSKLNIRMDRPYAAIHWRELLPHWTYSHKVSWLGATGDGETLKAKRFGTNAEELAIAMNRNEDMYAMIVTGYFDSMTSPAQAKYTTQRANIPRERLILENVESGHEPYVDAGVTRLLSDIRAMVRKAAP